MSTTNAKREEIEAAIASIDQKLNSGITSVTTDGTTTTVDLNALHKRRRELVNELDNMRQPVSMRVDLSKF
jgi:hypothetical protein